MFCDKVDLVTVSTSSFSYASIVPAICRFCAMSLEASGADLPYTLRVRDVLYLMSYTCDVH